MGQKLAMFANLLHREKKSCDLPFVFVPKLGTSVSDFKVCIREVEYYIVLLGLSNGQCRYA